MQIPLSATVSTRRNIIFFQKLHAQTFNVFSFSFDQRENPDEDFDEDRDDLYEEEPLVVVLKDGDLTAEEAEAIKKQKEDGTYSPLFS